MLLRADKLLGSRTFKDPYDVRKHVASSSVLVSQKSRGDGRLRGPQDSLPEQAGHLPECGYRDDGSCTASNFCSNSDTTRRGDIFVSSKPNGDESLDPASDEMDDSSGAGELCFSSSKYEGRMRPPFRGAVVVPSSVSTVAVPSVFVMSFTRLRWVSIWTPPDSWDGPRLCQPGIAGAVGGGHPSSSAISVEIQCPVSVPSHESCAPMAVAAPARFFFALLSFLG